MRTITTYTRRPKMHNAQTKGQWCEHKISVPFLGTWIVSDAVVQKMATRQSAEILGKKFSKATLTEHFNQLAK